METVLMLVGVKPGHTAKWLSRSDRDRDGVNGVRRTAATAIRHLRTNGRGVRRDRETGEWRTNDGSRLYLVWA